MTILTLTVISILVIISLVVIAGNIRMNFLEKRLSCLKNKVAIINNVVDECLFDCIIDVKDLKMDRIYILKLIRDIILYNNLSLPELIANKTRMEILEAKASEEKNG